MVKRDDLITFINKTIGHDLLDTAEKKDDMANGIQILGAKEVNTVTLGVSVNEEFLTKAVSDKSNFCIFHHGLDFNTYKQRLSIDQQKRLRLVINSNITVMGFHYALDAHKAIGNNAEIIKALGATVNDTLFEEWGFTATFETPVTPQALKTKCDDIFGRDVFMMKGGSEKIRTIGVVSGGAVPYAIHIREMIDKGVQAFISGETKESVPHRLKEAGIYYYVCGHYTTEVFGVKALAEVIKKHYGDKLTVEFIDIPNPI